MTTLSNSLSKIWMKISRQEKVAFFFAFFIGLLAHITILTNRFFNHDSILYTLVDPSSTFFLQQGKWLSLVAQRLMQGDITTSSIIIPVSLMCLGLTAALTVSILKIKSSLWAAATGGALVLFPSVMCANVYDASAIFFSALLLASFSVFVTTRWKYGFLAGVVLLTLSFGVYSVFSGYAAGLFVLSLLFDLINNRYSVKKALLKGLKYVAVLAISAVLYYAILKLLLRVQNVSLMNYRGIDQIGKFSIASFGESVYEAYRKVYYFFFYGIFLYRGHFEIEPIFRALNLLSIGSAAVFCGWQIYQQRNAMRVGRIILIAALTVLFPLAIHAIAVLSQNAYTHWIMCYPFVLTYVAMFASVDGAEDNFVSTSASKLAGKWRFVLFRIGTVLVLLITVLLFRHWFFTTNQGYEYIRYENENAIAKGTLLTNDIQQAEDYNTSVPIAFVGSETPDYFLYQTNDFLAIHGEDGIGYTGFNGAIVDNERLKMLIRNWIGVPLNYVDDTTLAELMNDPLVQAMPVYPAHGSIAMINGVLAVKLSEIQTEPLG